MALARRGGFGPKIKKIYSKRTKVFFLRNNEQMYRHRAKVIIFFLFRLVLLVKTVYDQNSVYIKIIIIIRTFLLHSFIIRFVCNSL